MSWGAIWPALSKAWGNWQHLDNSWVWKGQVLGTGPGVALTPIYLGSPDAQDLLPYFQILICPSRGDLAWGRQVSQVCIASFLPSLAGHESAGQGAEPIAGEQLEFWSGV